MEILSLFSQKVKGNISNLAIFAVEILKSNAMKAIYLVTESCDTNNILIQTWVCYTMGAARECLKRLYTIASESNRIRGRKPPHDSTQNNFFFWAATDDLVDRYEIKESEVFHY